MLALSLRQVSQKLCDGALAPSNLCEASISRAKSIKELNAFIRITEDIARRQAEEADLRFKQGNPQSVFDGIPIAVKDNFCTRDVETTCGSRMLEHFKPKYNATVVQKLQDAGAVLLGKCNMDEFAMGCGTVDSLYGPTKNIWQSKFDRLFVSTANAELGAKIKSGCREFHHDAAEEEEDWFIAGGSSGGSAVAVASGAVFAALGSDTGGSTRNPAAYCGVVGLKPSYGLLSRHGLIPLVNSMDVPGILTRTVDDNATLFNLLVGRDPLDSTTVDNELSPICLEDIPSVDGLRVGIPVEYHCPGLSEEVLVAWSKVADMLEEGGATVVQVSMPHTQASIACYSVLNQCEVASNMARYDGIEFGLRPPENKSTEELYAASRSQGFGQVVRSRILAGNYFLLSRNYSAYFVQALKVRRLIAQDFDKVWRSGVDVLLTPTTLTDAPRFSQFIDLDNRQQCSTQDFCTQPANLAGCPAISIPVSQSKHGLPVSLQLISKNYREDILFTVAKWIESAVKFPQLELNL
ncbi:glutamyl-tRNA(Gln) amidotransferase subunit A, mitochondrial [Anabrus simplex]|uniref:glutamyl-tRNA(Gln) amidotransferase subunit A, mitochondrial n=1 Tax=Anabrus simplex TaxID=316456 RepID=UPI0035A37E85